MIAANQARGSASNPITVTFAPALNGQRITLYGQLPFLTASSATFQVASAAPNQRVRIALGTTSFVASGTDLTFRNLSFEGGVADSVSLFGCWGTTFENCDFLDTGETGVFAVAAWRTVFKSCLFDGAPTFRGMGVLATDGTDDLRIEGSVFRNFPAGTGLTCTGVSDLVVTGCGFSKCSGGIHLLESCQHPVIGPQVTFDSNYGAALVAALAVGMRVTDCTFRSNGGSGVYLQDRSDGAVLERCTFDRNGLGSSQNAAGASQIVVRDTSGATLRQSTVSGGSGAGLEALNVVGLVIEP
jgi:hypothetical protein